MESYRALYSDRAYSVVPSIFSLLGKDLSLLPPADVTGKAGRPNKEPKKRTRFPSTGEFKTSAQFSQQRLENLKRTVTVAASVSGSRLS